MQPTPSGHGLRRPAPQGPWRALLGLALACLFAACSSSPDKRTLQYMNEDGFGKRYVGNAEEENYVSIGDSIIVFDVLHPTEINLRQTVDIDGRVLLPEIGSISVAGYTRSDLESVLRERYALYYDENEIVVDISTRSKYFWVLGEVAGDGRKNFTGDTTVFEAVMQSNPRKDSANLGRVMLVRGDPRDPLVLPVNINDIIRGDTSSNYRVQENDIVLVQPTLLAEFGYFLDALLFPVKQVLRGLGGAFFNAGNRRGRRGRNNNPLLFGGLF